MKRHINYYFLGLSAILLIFFILFLATLSSSESLKVFGNTNYYLFHQLTAIAIGFVLMLVILKTPLSIIKKIAPILLLLNLLLLLFVFLPHIGVKFWGAKRWISIGQNTIQPSEFLKITVILYLAAWLSNKFSENSKRNLVFFVKKGYHNFTKSLLPFLLLLALIAVILYLQKDASTLGIIVVALTVM